MKKHIYMIEGGIGRAWFLYQCAGYKSYKDAVKQKKYLCGRFPAMSFRIVKYVRVEEKV